MPLLYQHGDQAAPVLKERLEKFLGNVRSPEIPALIRDLDSNEFVKRRAADEKLRQLGAAARPALRNATRELKALEGQHRAERIPRPPRRPAALAAAPVARSAADADDADDAPPRPRTSRHAARCADGAEFDVAHHAISRAGADRGSSFTKMDTLAEMMLAHAIEPPRGIG
jgi:hypothetical protein